MVQPYPSTGKSVEPEQPAAPPSVLNAVKHMYAGAAVSTITPCVMVGGIVSGLAVMSFGKPLIST